MKEKFLQLKPKDRRDILLDAASRLNRQPIVLEKDIWVCTVLQFLFEAEMSLAQIKYIV